MVPKRKSLPSSDFKLLYDILRGDKHPFVKFNMHPEEGKTA